jgi:anti-sigma B factor antagonist
MLTLQETKRSGHPVLRLSGELTIYSAAEARQSLGDHLDRAPAPLELDLSGLEELDTAGVQVLAWLKREALAHNRTLALVNHSPAVIEVFDLLKVAGLFGDPILITPPNL